MGWSKRTKEIVVKSEAELQHEMFLRAEREHKLVKKIEWIRTVSNSEVTEQFCALETQLKNVTGNPDKLGEEDSVAYQMALDGFYQIKQCWFEIDRNLLDDNQALTMFNGLNEYFPNMLTTFQSDIFKYGINWGWRHNYGDSGLTAEYRIIFERLSKIKNFQINQTRLGTIVPPVISNNMVFPHFESTEQVNQLLFRVERLWLQATSRKNSVEDDYFLEQIVSSYLPEAWMLFNTFKYAPESSRLTAENIFMEQLTLIEQHIVHILQTVMNQNLMAMRNQVDFLKVKTALPETNSLALTPVGSR